MSKKPETVLESEPTIENKTELVSGVIVPLITPSDGQGRVDKQSTINLVTHLHNVDGLLVIGTAGEFASLTLEQKTTAVNSVAEAIDGLQIPRKPHIFVNVSALTANEMLQEVRCAESVKADALVIAPLFGEEGTPEDRLLRLTELTNLPIVLYNLPPELLPHLGEKGRLSIDFISRFISAHPKIIGMKDSSRDQTYLDSLRELQTDKFHLATGNTDLLLYAVTHDVNGIIPILGNLFPDKLLELFAQKSEKLQQELKEDRAKFKNVPEIKAELANRGWIDSPAMFD